MFVSTILRLFALIVLAIVWGATFVIGIFGIPGNGGSFFDFVAFIAATMLLTTAVPATYFLFVHALLVTDNSKVSTGIGVALAIVAINTPILIVLFTVSELLLAKGTFPSEVWSGIVIFTIDLLIQFLLFKYFRKSLIAGSLSNES